MIEYITVIDKNGNGMLTEGIMYARIKTIDSGVAGVEGKEYIFYTLDETVEDNRKKIYISEAALEAGKANPISDEAWSIIRKILMQISHKEETPEVEFKKMNGITFHVSDPKKLAIEVPVKQALKDAYFSGTLAAQPQEATMGQSGPTFFANSAPVAENQQQNGTQVMDAFSATPPMPEATVNPVMEGIPQVTNTSAGGLNETGVTTASDQEKKEGTIETGETTTAVANDINNGAQKVAEPTQVEATTVAATGGEATTISEAANNPNELAVAEVSIGITNGEAGEVSDKEETKEESAASMGEEQTSKISTPQKSAITQVPDHTLTGGLVLEEEPVLLPPDEIQLDQTKDMENIDETVTIEDAEKAIKILIAYIKKTKKQDFINESLISLAQGVTNDNVISESQKDEPKQEETEEVVTSELISPVIADVVSVSELGKESQNNSQTYEGNPDPTAVVTTGTTTGSDPAIVVTDPTTVVTMETTAGSDPAIGITDPTTVVTMETTAGSDPAIGITDPTTVVTTGTTTGSDPAIGIIDPTTVVTTGTTTGSDPAIVITDPTTVVTTGTTTGSEPAIGIIDPTAVVTTGTTSMDSLNAAKEGNALQTGGSNVVTDKTVSEFLIPVSDSSSTKEEPAFIDTSVTGINKSATTDTNINTGLTTVNITIPTGNANAQNDTLQPKQAAPITSFEPEIPMVESKMPGAETEENYTHIATQNQAAAQLGIPISANGTAAPVQMPDGHSDIAEARSKMKELVNLGPSGLTNTVPNTFAA